MNTTPTAFELVTERLSQPDGRVVVHAPGARRQLLLSPADLPKIKAEGNGIRFGKLFFFGSQLRFARVR